MASKRTAIVKVTRVQGINKKTYTGNSTVSEDMFPEGNFDLLVANGYLQLIEAKKAEIEKPKKVAKEEK
jgi:hypothetical protein